MNEQDILNLMEIRDILSNMDDNGNPTVAESLTIIDRQLLKILETVD